MMKVILIALSAIAVANADTPKAGDTVTEITEDGETLEFVYEQVPAEVKFAEPYVNDAESTVTIVKEEAQSEPTTVFYTTEVTEFEWEYVGANPVVIEVDAEHEEFCTDIEVQDCDSNCAPAFWIANGYCNDGAKAQDSGSDYITNGNVLYQGDIEKGSGHHKQYNFNCAEFWFDGGDCEDTAEAVKENYIAQGINGGTVFLQKVTPNTPVLAMGILAVVAAVGVVMKRN